MDSGIAGQAEQEAASLFDGRVPIMIGATGHRDLGKAEAAIDKSIRRECQRLKKSYPKTPFVVLSSLAEGADRLIAKIALEELDAKLFAVLPLPEDEYCKDFKSEGSSEQFGALLAKAARRIEVCNASQAQLWSVEVERRNEQYARSGAIVAEQSQILFAVWDGKPARGTGGTAEVVAWFQRGYPSKRYSGFPNSISPLDPAEPGKLIHIDPIDGNIKRTLVPSADYPEKFAAGARPYKKRSFANARRSDIHQILKRTERFNRDVARNRQAILANEAIVEPKKTPAAAPKDADATYRAADALAVLFARRVRASDLVLYGMALLAVFFFNMLNNWPVAPLAYFGIASIVLATAICLRLLFYESRFLEYRGLAEALRVLFFWRVAGVSTPVWLCYLSKHSGVVHWIRQAVRAVEFSEDSLRPKPLTVTPDALEFVTENWVEGQMKYYDNAGERHWRHYRRWMWGGRISLILSFALALAFLVLAVTHWGGYWKWDAAAPKDAVGYSDGISIATDKAIKWLQVALGLFAALGLAVKSFLARRADFELVKHFASARQTFGLAMGSLESAKTGAEPGWTKEEILEKLGREALLEQAEWLWLRHSRPFEMPN